MGLGLPATDVQNDVQSEEEKQNNLLEERMRQWGLHANGLAMCAAGLCQGRMHSYHLRYLP